MGKTKGTEVAEQAKKKQKKEVVVEEVEESNSESDASASEEEEESVQEEQQEEGVVEPMEGVEGAGKSAAGKRSSERLADSEVARLRGLLNLLDGKCGAPVPSSLDPVLCDIPHAPAPGSLCATCVQDLLATLQKAADDRRLCREAVCAYRDLLAAHNVSSIKASPGDDLYILPSVFVQEVERVCFGNLTPLKRKTGFTEVMLKHPSLPLEHETAPLLAFARLAEVFVSHYKLDTVTDFLKCEHGQLPTKYVKTTAVTPNWWKRAVGAYGDLMGSAVQPGTLKPCTVCTEASGKEKEMVQAREQLRAELRLECKGWEDPSYFADNASAKVGTYYLLPSAWYREWRLFVLAKGTVDIEDGATEVLELPLPPLSFEKCLCTHRLLVSGIWGSLLPGQRGLSLMPDDGFLVITKEHRDTIVERFGEDADFPLPCVELREDESSVETPSVCQQCSTAANSRSPDAHFENAYFWIVYPKKESTQVDIEGGKMVDKRVLALIESLSKDEAEAWRSAVLPDSKGEGRSTSRAARSSDFDAVILRGVDSSITCDQLCSRISEETGPSAGMFPCFMTLYVRGRRLVPVECEDLPLGVLEFPPNCAIFVTAPDPEGSRDRRPRRTSGRTRGTTVDSDDGFEPYDPAAFESAGTTDIVPRRGTSRRQKEEPAFEQSVFAGQ